MILTPVVATEEQRERDGEREVGRTTDTKHLSRKKNRTEQKRTGTNRFA